ncbi:MAG: geranylgeranyl reductase family protein, partial [Firmicutes bacterium]|nr:geranylgeranyl reductase family protein [Bacillota bacterium]
MDYDVVVVGAGPAGCTTARLVAQAGYRVLVLEEHPAAGEPVRCAGLVSPRTLEVAGLDGEVVLATVTGARIHGPLGAVLSVEGNRAYALAVDRAEFDRRLAAAAAAAGAELAFSARVTGLERVGGGVRVRWRRGRRKAEVAARLVVGADGPNSLVARWCGLPPPPAAVRLWAAEVELPHAREGTVELFLGRAVAPGWFGWLIPVGPSLARVGTGSADGEAPGACFRRLAARYPGIFGAARVVRTTGGAVPLGLRPRCYGERALVVG